MIEDRAKNSIDKLNKFVEDIPPWNPKDYFKETLRKWNSFTMIISGSRMAGKSNFLKYLLCEPLRNEFNMIVVFSKTIENGFYQNFIDSKLMFKNINGEIITMLSKAYHDFKEKGKKFRYLVILDDFIDAKTRYNEQIADLFYLGRHNGASIICLTQKLSMLSLGWFTNTMIFVTLFSGSRAENVYVNEKLVVDTIYEKFPEKKKNEIETTGYYILRKIAQNYNALIILPYEKEKLFQLKAPLMKTKKDKKKSVFEEFISGFKN